MQYNVLFDSPNPGCIDEYVRSYTAAEDLSWATRAATVARRIRESADVAFVEELGPEMFVILKRALPEFDAWHASEFVRKVEHPDGEEIALFVRRAAAELVGAPRCQRLVSFARSEAERTLMMMPEQPGDSPPEAYAVITAAVRRRGWGPDQVLVLGGTHLRWEFDASTDAPIRAAAAGKPVQAVCAARALSEHASAANASAVALAGDFNSPPTDGAVLALTQGLPVGHPKHPGGGCAELRGPTPLRSAFAAVHGREPLFTRKKNSAGSQFAIDYVLVGDGRGSVRVVTAGFGAGPPPYAQDGNGDDLPYLPCAAWPSDHLPLTAELQCV